MNDEGPQLRVSTSVESLDGATVAVIALEGELDLGVLDQLNDALHGQDEHRGVVIDLSGLEFVDSAGIHALVAKRESFDESGTRSALVVTPGSNVERILDMTGLLERLASRPDRDSALAAVASGPDE